MRFNTELETQKLGGVTYLTSLGEKTIGLINNINKEDNRLEKYITKSSYGKEYNITQDHIKEELEKNYKDIWSKFDRIRTTDNKSGIENIITSAHSDHAIILIKCLLRELNKTKYKQERQAYIIEILERLNSEMKNSNAAEQKLESDRITEISQLTQELTTILDSQKKDTSLDKDYLVNNLIGILEIIRETCKNDDKFKEKLKETLGSINLTENNKNQLIDYMLSIFKDLQKGKDELFLLAETIQGGRGVCISPTKRGTPHKEAYERHPDERDPLVLSSNPMPAHIGQQDELQSPHFPDKIYTKSTKRDTRPNTHNSPHEMNTHTSPPLLTKRIYPPAYQSYTGSSAIHPTPDYPHSQQPPGYSHLAYNQHSRQLPGYIVSSTRHQGYIVSSQLVYENDPNQHSNRNPYTSQPPPVTRFSPIQHSGTHVPSITSKRNVVNNLAGRIISQAQRPDQHTLRCSPYR